MTYRDPATQVRPRRVRVAPKMPTSDRDPASPSIDAVAGRGSCTAQITRSRLRPRPDRRDAPMKAAARNRTHRTVATKETHE